MSDLTMRLLKLTVEMLLLGWFAVSPAGAAGVIEADVCVYGGTSGGVVVATQAARQGKKVALAVFGTHLGGMTSGGLGATDAGNSASITGVSREFYERIAQRYSGTGARFNFEPHVAEEIFSVMLAEVAVTPRWNQRIATVTKSGPRITAMTMEDGTVYRARVFIDATYEGDLMAMAGVTFTVGREAVSTYGESLNGVRANTPAHQFTVNVDPYVSPGDPASGLLPYISSGAGGTPGAADAGVQAYNYRLCLTTTPANRLPIEAPPGYDEARFEVLGRLIDARVAAGQTLTLGSFMNIAAMPNGKTDINNNGAFSTDAIGMNHQYPTASHVDRERIAREHLEYIQGFLFYLGHSQRVPLAVRNSMLTYGRCADEFRDTGGWPHQLYVREARRMVSDYVMLQQDCQGSRSASDPIALGSYTMDSHNIQRLVQGGVVRNEGDVQSGVPQPYGISYRSIVPRVGECDNLLVPWALSASHVAFGSIRMEPVFMMTSQSAATAAAFTIDDNVPVQQIDYHKLKVQLQADKLFVLSGSSGGGGIIVDNGSSGATISGSWTSSTSQTGYWGSDYIHDQSTGKGSKSVTFTPNLPATGEYDVYARWTINPNRSTNVPLDVVSATGTETFLTDQRSNGGVWFFLKRAQFNAGVGGSVVVRTSGTVAGTFVIADAARWVPVGGAFAVPVEIVGSDPVTRESDGTDWARLTLVRPTEEATNQLQVNYALSGTALPADYVLSGNATFAAGATTASIRIDSISDALAEGTEVLTLTLEPGPGYSIGVLKSAQVSILDRPIDAWRHRHFSAGELAESSISSDLADPDRDGLNNLLEYPLSFDPRSAEETAGNPRLLVEGFTLTYSVRRDATDVVVTAEGSYDLSSWSTDGRVEELARVDEGATERITVRLLPASPPAASGYLRLKVTR